jgi:NAD-dependent dihydropyrimidine dehydrogenase PreA subunit
MKPQVDESKCTGCGNCVEVCPSEVFELKDEKSKVVRPEECVECETCVSECAEEAITLVD